MEAIDEATGPMQTTARAGGQGKIEGQKQEKGKKLGMKEHRTTIYHRAPDNRKSVQPKKELSVDE